MELILYNPTANQAKFRPIKINFGVDVSHSRLPNVDSTLKMFVMGVNMAVVTVLMLKILRVFPDIHIMNALIKICWPGFVARPIAFAFRLATSAEEFWDGAVDVVAPLRSAASRLEWPTVGEHFDKVWNPSWFSLRFKSIEYPYLNKRHFFVSINKTDAYRQC